MTLIVPLPTTCGLLIISPQGWLLGHSTGTPYWDLPKGKKELGEPSLDAALRECLEETGLDLRSLKERCAPLGGGTYNRKRGKTLELFLLELETPLDLSQCRCQTWVTTRGEDALPDMDDYAWIPEEKIEQHVKPRMAKYLRRLGVLRRFEANTLPA